MTKPVLDEVARQILSCRRFMPILYLVTEDRELIYDLLKRGDCFDVLQKDPGGQYIPAAYEKGMESSNVVFQTSSSFKKPDSELRQKPVVYILKDFQLQEEYKQKELIAKYIGMTEELDEWPIQKNLIIVSSTAPYSCIPSGFDQYIQIIDIPMLGMWEIENMVISTQNKVLKLMGLREIRIDQYEKNTDPYIDNFKGMNRTQICFILDQLSNEFGWVSRYGLPEKLQEKLNYKKLEATANQLIFEQKRQMVKKDGAVAFLTAEGIVTPGGMEGLHTWLQQKKKVLENPKKAARYGEKFPRGILIAGLPGSGKSLVAKYISKELGLPLIHFDLGMVLNGVVGGTEEKMDRVLKLMEASAPCVVWIDEIEKELGGTQGSGESDAGTAKRCLARLLQWMQENEKQCFICATANHTETLPPELLRRGRFDRKYYMFLPLQEQCVEIMKNQLRHMADKAPELFDEAVIGSCTALGNEIFETIAEMPRKFFTGADLEGLIQDAKSDLFNRGQELPYNYIIFKEALIEAAKRSKPYAETNFVDVLDYWIDLQARSFQSAAVSDTCDGEEKYKYLLFDFTDIENDGKCFKWRKGLACRSEYAYDQRMFKALKEGIENRMNVR